jgi:hypothetical protein
MKGKEILQSDAWNPLNMTLHLLAEVLGEHKMLSNSLSEGFGDPGWTFFCRLFDIVVLVFLDICADI